MNDRVNDKASKLYIYVDRSSSFLVRYSLPILVLSIVSLVISEKYRNTTCDGDILQLYKWVQVNAIVELLFVALVGKLLFFCIVHKYFENLWSALSVITFGAAFVVYGIMYIPFHFVWTVIGSIEVFQSSCLNSETGPIYVLCVVILVLKYQIYLRTLLDSCDFLCCKKAKNTTSENNQPDNDSNTVSQLINIVTK